MDTTLLFPSNIVVNAEDKPIIVERLGVVLSKIGMTNVSVRSTARIPIVQFRDPLHGMHRSHFSFHMPYFISL
jgi:DNA polymerase sigma